MRRWAPAVRWIGLVGIVAGAVVATALTSLPASAAICSSEWEVVDTPNVDEDEITNSLGSLAVVSPNDVWAVGYAGTYGAQQSTLAQHWNGTAWSIVPTPNGVNEVNWLAGVDAVSANNVWAVGSTATNPPNQSLSRNLILRWNGTAWSTVPAPHPTPPLPGPVSNQLLGVDAVSANDVWAVGQTWDYGTSRTLIVHWNGTAWSRVPSPSPGTWAVLRSISAVSANDVWAAGTALINGNQRTLIQHWNGSTWSTVPSPNDGPYVQELMKIRAVSANDIWAVGYHNHVFGFNQVNQTSIFHYNGTAWSVVPSPDVNQLNNYLFGVDGVSATDAWAVGFWDTGFELRTMTQHWDGTAWTITPSPVNSDYIDELIDVIAVSPTEWWAVGQSTGFFTFGTFAIHLGGTCSPAMHVGSITPRYLPAQRAVQTQVAIVDGTGAPVPGATMSIVVTRPNGFQATHTRTTAANGIATLQVSAQTRGTYSFRVTNVTKSGVTYDPAANVETTDSITI